MNDKYIVHHELPKVENTHNMSTYDQIELEKKNKEEYSDPTCYNALNRLDEDNKVHKIMKMIFTLLDLTGFYLDGRITLVSKKTGRTWN